MTVLNAALVVVGAGSVWSWRRGRSRGAGALPVARLWAFLGGLVAIALAMSPLLGSRELGALTGHMLRHLVLMTVAAPLLLLGAPIRLLQTALRGGRSARELRSPHPLLCWSAGTGVVLFWHVPVLFELGMRWHALQHASFLAAGLLFWIPVLRPWPMVTGWSRWSIPPYLFLATLPCDALSAFLAFCGRVVYARACPGAGLSALVDQVRAGALMWFWVTVAYLVPAALETVRLLSPSTARSSAQVES